MASGPLVHKLKETQVNRVLLLSLPISGSRSGTSPIESSAEMTDQYNLGRFVAAQANTYEAALSEIKRGAKRTHWMWYVFPQVAGLGTSLRSGRRRRLAN